jgi:O-acetylhomoserine/O-acetylserine sulfhydrylase-like pyridoxal-dependent enzyme
VDITAHALTKYPSGGGDVLMGSIITRDANLHMRIKLTHMRLGIGIGANDAELLLRSLPSVGLRYHAHDVAARDLARWLGQQPAVVQVLHPALEGAPGHVHWKALCGAAHGGQGAAAGLFSVVIDPKYGQDAVDRFCDSLQLFKLGYSWGGPISLVVPYDIERMRSQPHAQLKAGPSCAFRSVWSRLTTCVPTWRRRCLRRLPDCAERAPKSRALPGFFVVAVRAVFSGCRRGPFLRSARCGCLWPICSQTRSAETAAGRCRWR